MIPTTTEESPVLLCVTPAQAALWLETADPGNRISQAHVDQLAGAMREGSLHYRGAPIEFRLGRLVNGHHRLLALRRHGRPVWLLVLGAPPQKNNLTPGAAQA